jgi:hypothetical protein
MVAAFRVIDVRMNLLVPIEELIVITLVLIVHLVLIAEKEIQTVVKMEQYAIIVEPTLI